MMIVLSPQNQVDVDPERRRAWVGEGATLDAASLDHVSAHAVENSPFEDAYGVELPSPTVYLAAVEYIL